MFKLIRKMIGVQTIEDMISNPGELWDVQSMYDALREKYGYTLNQTLGIMQYQYNVEFKGFHMEKIFKDPQVMRITEGVYLEGGEDTGNYRKVED